MTTSSWKQVKPGRIEKGNHAIVTTKRSDESKVFTLYKGGDIIDFFGSEKDAKDSIKLSDKSKSKKKLKKKSSK